MRQIGRRPLTNYGRPLHGSSRRGAALRFALTLLALVQTKRKPGAKARLIDLGLEVTGSSQKLGWADFLAADAADSNSGGVYLTARDKRARSVRNARMNLESAGLVSVPGAPGLRNRFENFVLLNERGIDTLPSIRAEQDQS